MNNTPLLAGIKILDLTRLLPGPFATCLLADLGAEVLKVEEPSGGDYMRDIPPLAKKQGAIFVHLNRNKRSLALDLKAEAGRQVFLRLLETYDVLLEGFRPGTLARLNLGYEALQKKQPRLIYAAISGYGQSGAYRLRAGHDINYCAIAGDGGLTGTIGGQPAIAGHQAADLSGALYLAIAVLSAVLRRERTGAGCSIDIAMTDCVRMLAYPQLADFIHSGEPAGPAKHVLSGKCVCYNLYRTQDDRFISLGALEPKFWANFCRAVDKEHLLNEAFAPARPDHPVKMELDLLFARHTQAEWAAFFSQHDCCCEPVLTLAEAAAHPHVTERGLLRQVQHPTEGLLNLLAQPMRFEPAPEPAYRPAPALGEHSTMVLKEIGYSEQEIAGLKKLGVIGGQ